MDGARSLTSPDVSGASTQSFGSASVTQRTHALVRIAHPANAVVGTNFPLIKTVRLCVIMWIE